MSAAAALVVAGSVAVLLAAQIVLACVRVRCAPRRSEAVWFTLFLGALLGLTVTSAAGPGGLIATSVLLWVAGAYLAARAGEAAPPWWHAAAGLVTIGVLVCLQAGWWGGQLWLAPVAGAAALAVYPQRRLCARRPGPGAPLPRYLCGIGLLPVAGSLTDQIVQLSGRAPLSLAVLGTGALALWSGYLLAQLDYLRAPARSLGDTEDQESDAWRRARRPPLADQASEPGGVAGPGHREPTHTRQPESEEDGLLLQHRLAITGYLTAGVAHEFKNILGHIKTTAEWGATGGDALRALQLIRSHVGAGVTGVNEMLTTTLRDGPEARSKVSVLREINRILGVVAATLQTARVTIRLRVPEELALVTRKRELMLALLNLIQNAGQATAERNSGGGAVTVTGRTDGELCILEVTDAAGGVDPAAAGRLFDRGFGTGSGSGLGLHLARRLIERNDGDLTYHAIPGGSCFRIALPMDPP